MLTASTPDPKGIPRIGEWCIIAWGCSFGFAIFVLPMVLQTLPEVFSGGTIVPGVITNITLIGYNCTKCVNHASNHDCPYYVTLPCYKVYNTVVLEVDEPAMCSMTYDYDLYEGDASNHMQKLAAARNIQVLHRSGDVECFVIDTKDPMRTFVKVYAGIVISIALCGFAGSIMELVVIVVFLCVRLHLHLLSGVIRRVKKANNRLRPSDSGTEMLIVA